MRHWWLAICLGAVGVPAQPSGTPATARPADVTPVAVPEFDAERGLQWSSTRAEYDRARADTGYLFEQFTYTSDGLTVGAYLYRPRVRPAPARPVIVYSRGSYVRPTGFAGEMLVMANRFAQAGFVVVAPHYRGSNGWAGRDEMGGADLADLLNIVPFLSGLEGADATRLYLAGESRGGTMVYQALRDGFPAKAAAVWGAFTDLAPLIAPGGPQAAASAQLAKVLPDLVQHREAYVERRSALRWAERIHTPVLLMHGTADADIPIDQSERMAAALARLGRTHRFVPFDGEQHRIGGRGADRDAETVAWFRRFGG